MYYYMKLGQPGHLYLRQNILYIFFLCDHKKVSADCQMTILSLGLGLAFIL